MCRPMRRRERIMLAFVDRPILAFSYTQNAHSVLSHALMRSAALVSHAEYIAFFCPRDFDLHSRRPPCRHRYVTTATLGTTIEHSAATDNIVSINLSCAGPRLRSMGKASRSRASYESVSPLYHTTVHILSIIPYRISFIIP